MTINDRNPNKDRKQIVDIASAITTIVKARVSPNLYMSCAFPKRVYSVSTASGRLSSFKNFASTCVDGVGELVYGKLRCEEYGMSLPAAYSLKGDSHDNPYKLQLLARRPEFLDPEIFQRVMIDRWTKLDGKVEEVITGQLDDELVKLAMSDWLHTFLITTR